MTSTQNFVFATALTTEGWRNDVAVRVEEGLIAAVEPDASATGDADRYEGAALPGLSNLHSHAFQRGMAGLAERGAAGDQFWTWRATMYRFLEALTPDDIETIAALAYMEMLEAGFTAVGEFHYLHKGPSGPYDALAETAARVAIAGSETGIALTLLPVFYAHAGFDDGPLAAGQRRFVTSLDEYVRLVEAASEIVRHLPNSRLGIAPHSLRAATPTEVQALTELAGSRVIHIHIAEQMKEVEDCVAALGARPVEWLLGNHPVGPRWCLVHATHLTPAEMQALAGSGAVAGLCPVTEANLGDGIFPLTTYAAAGGRMGIGTDSNVAISTALELRALEYSQRLRDLRRTSGDAGVASTGRRLFDLAVAGGAAALDQPTGALAVGRRADIVVLDTTDPGLVGRRGDAILDSWIFAARERAVREVFVAGRKVVSGGRHIRRAEILGRWTKAAARLADAV